MDPRALPGVAESRSYAHCLPSRFADPIALAGIDAATDAVVPPDDEDPPELLELPTTVNVVVATGHMPLLVQDLK